MGRAGHQAGPGEIRVGQELGLLVEGERGLLVLQVGSRDPGVRVPHAAPDRTAGVGAPHAAAGGLIHGKDFSQSGAKSSHSKVSFLKSSKRPQEASNVTSAD